MKYAAFSGIAALVAGAGILLATAGSSSAITCPRGTSPHTYTVPHAGVSVGACKPGQTPECDPAECPATARPQH